MRKLIAFCLALTFALVSTSYGACDCGTVCAVLGNWEQQSDGWFDWGNKEPIDSPNNMPGKYQYSQEDVTLGEWSLNLNQCGWNQNLAYGLTAAEKEAWQQCSCFCIDVSIYSDVEGWAEIYEIALNVEGCGWTPYAMPVHWEWDANDVPVWEHATVCIDYSECLEELEGLTPGWVEFIFATNNDSQGSHCDFYFDNARLCVPEPTTIALLGLGSLALLRRKRA